MAAEMLMDGQRSRGEGVVQFQATEQAQTAGEKFTGYSYGGRPLGECTSIRLPSGPIVQC